MTNAFTVSICFDLVRSKELFGKVSGTKAAVPVGVNGRAAPLLEPVLGFWQQWQGREMGRPWSVCAAFPVAGSCPWLISSRDICPATYGVAPAGGERQGRLPQLSLPGRGEHGWRPPATVCFTSFPRGPCCSPADVDSFPSCRCSASSLLLPRCEGLLKSAATAAADDPKVRWNMVQGD